MGQLWHSPRCRQTSPENVRMSTFLPPINELLHLVEVGIVDGVVGTSHNKEGSMTEPKAQSPPKAHPSSEKPDLAVWNFYTASSYHIYQVVEHLTVVGLC